MKFRDGTQDAQVLQEVREENCYRLPDAIHGIVVDIGAHIGVFALECLKRGGRVICAEPEYNNFQLLKENTKEFQDRVTLHHLMVWGSHEPLALRHAGHNTGMHVTIPHPQGKSPSATLDELTKDVEQVDLLKLDCEGAEFPILSASSLDKVSEVVCELHYHCYPNNREVIEQLLSERGFECQTVPNPRWRNNALVFAKRRTEQVTMN